VANSYAKDQWAHMRQLGVPAAQEAQEEDNNRCPKWDTAPPTTKKEWKSSIALMKKKTKKKTSALTEPDASAPFRVSLFPSCLLRGFQDQACLPLFVLPVRALLASGARGFR
jgi:hypothetical protein